MMQPTDRYRHLDKYLAELLGTFVLVFAGTTAIVVNELSSGAVSHTGVALVFGLAVTAMIYAFGDVSGAHINPAVSLALWYAGRLPGRRLGPYITAQLLGALGASGLVSLLFTGHATLGGTQPAGGVFQTFLLEVVLTFILMLTIVNLSAAQHSTAMNGAVIGGVVACAALFAGPISGASMNPARSIGPGLLSGQWQTLWIYVAAPVLGALLAVPCCRCLRPRPCCRAVLE